MNDKLIEVTVHGVFPNLDDDFLEQLGRLLETEFDAVLTALSSRPVPDDEYDERCDYDCSRCNPNEDY